MRVCSFDYVCVVDMLTSSKTEPHTSYITPQYAPPPPQNLDVTIHHYDCRPTTANATTAVATAAALSRRRILVRNPAILPAANGKKRAGAGGVPEAGSPPGRV